MEKKIPLILSGSLWKWESKNWKQNSYSFSLSFLILQKEINFKEHLFFIFLFLCSDFKKGTSEIVTLGCNILFFTTAATVQKHEGGKVAMCYATSVMFFDHFLIIIIIWAQKTTPKKTFTYSLEKRKTVFLFVLF